MQAPSRFLDEIPDELLTGMVDKRSRQESSFKRMTSWGDEEDISRSPAARPAANGAGAPSQRRPPGGRPVRANPAGARAAIGRRAGPRARQAARGRTSRRKSAAAQSKSEPAAKPKFERRDSVQHASFGVGTVIESTITRDGEEVTVAFPGVGIKKLLAEYLRKL
ncbi:MAG: hypothetical protein V9G12_09985 [Microthrixaceae bacterium]